MCSFCVLYIWLSTAFAGGIQGVIIDQTKQPVRDAKVSLLELRRNTKADIQGSFEFTEIPEGTYSLLVSSQIFGTKLFSVQVFPNQLQKVVLEVDLTVHEDMVVSAAPIHKSVSDVVTAVGVLNKENLIEKLESSLGETLASEPGVSSTYFGPTASRPVIRGLGGDRVRVLEGGMSSGDASSVSADHAVAIDPMTAERIEILRGPASLRYGASAVGGAINIIDNRIPEYLPTAVTGALELHSATVNDELRGGITLSGAKKRLAWHLAYSAKESNDFKIPGPAQLEDETEEDETADDHEEGEHVLENSSQEIDKGSIGLSFISDRGFVGVSYSNFETRYGIPVSHHEEHAELEEEEEEPPVTIDMVQKRVDLRGEYRLGSALFEILNMRVGQSRYQHQELEGEELGTHFRNELLEIRGEALHQKLGVLDSGSLGIQYSERDFEAVGEEAFVPPNQSEMLGLFFYEEVERAQWNIVFGVRYEHQATSAQIPPSEGMPTEQNIDITHGGFSSSLGFVAGKQSLFGFGVNLTRTERAPTPEELFSNGPHLATASFEKGDLNLDKEISLGFDLNLHKNKGLVTGEISLFANRFDRFIFQENSGEQLDGLDLYRFTQQDAEFIGGEVHADITLIHEEPHHLHLDLSYDTVRAQLDDDSWLPRVTPNRFSASLEYKRPQFHINLEAQWVADANRVSDPETSTQGYTLFNTGLGYHFFTGTVVHQLLLRASNLGNEEARSHNSFLKESTLLPGRNLAFTWRLSF